MGVDYQQIRNKYLSKENPLIRFAFSSKRRKMGTVLYNIDGDGMRLHEKGAPETILYSCKEIHTLEVNGEFRK